jgi:hypothetical protein
MGDPLVGSSVERINNDGNYEPSNYTWATRIEQCSNRRSNIFLEYRGKRQTLAQWSRQLGIKRESIKERLDRGWTVGKAFETPI